MKLLRVLSCGMLALACLTSIPTPAGASTAAAPPANDGLAGAITLAKPSSVQLDTTGATRDADDQRAENACAWWKPISPHNSVWYRYTPTSESEQIRFSTAGSSYDARIAVFSHFDEAGVIPTSLACDQTIADETLDPSEGTYTIVVYQPVAQPGGGDLKLTVSDVPQPKADVTVDPTAKVSADGKTAVLTGTITCSQSCVTVIRAKVQQGRVAASGRTSDEFPANEVRRWTAPVEVDGGVLRPGRASVQIDVDAMLSTGQDQYTFTTGLRLRR